LIEFNNTDVTGAACISALKMNLINKLNLRRSLGLAAGTGRFLVRHATAKDMELITREAIKEGWHVGPYDYPSAFAFDPKGFFIGEVNGKAVCHISAITYPNHHAYMGAYFVDEQHRGNGYGPKVGYTAYDYLDKSYTIGVDLDSRFKHRYKALGFTTLWNTYVAMLNLVTRLLKF
jgi:GNAT superfamily N-acetyltransferase